jgi:hypothetical protein
MRNRDFGFVALGRFLAVEQYYETQLTYVTDLRRSPGADRTAGSTREPDSRSGTRTPAAPRHP